MTQVNLLSSKCSGWYLGKVCFFLGGGGGEGGWAGAFWVYCLF